jgi:hypothetical protein
MPLVAVTVGQIAHHFALVNLFMLVDLPEDDAPGLGGSQPVLARGVFHLLLREETVDYHCAAEGALRRECLAPHRFVYDQSAVEYLDYHAEHLADAAE